MSAARTVLAPLDAARAVVLRTLGPLASPLLADREARVGVTGAVAVAMAFALTCVAPLGLLIMAPLAFGVPHLVADVRYLVVRTGFARRAELWVAWALSLVLPLVCGHAWGGLLVGPVAVIAARAAAWKRGVAMALWVPLCLEAWWHPHLADLFVAQGHNVLALGIFWAWTARRHRYHWLTFGLFGAGLALLTSGACDRFVSSVSGAGRWLDGSLDFSSLIRELAPVSGRWSLRWVLVFAFAQSVHYAVWLRLIPEVDRPRPGLRSFGSSWDALARDLGWPFVLAACFALAVFVAWGFVDAGVARHAYLRVSGFHAFLELGIVTWLVLEGRLPLRRTC